MLMVDVNHQHRLLEAKYCRTGGFLNIRGYA
jgi:hypothetical protein